VSNFADSLRKEGRPSSRRAAEYDLVGLAITTSEANYSNQGAIYDRIRSLPGLVQQCCPGLLPLDYFPFRRLGAV
jgi:hypothetical protein